MTRMDAFYMVIREMRENTHIHTFSSILCCVPKGTTLTYYVRFFLESECFVFKLCESVAEIHFF